MSVEYTAARVSLNCARHPGTWRKSRIHDFPEGFVFATLPATLKLLKSSSFPLVSNFEISSSFLFVCLLVFSRKLNWGTNQVFCHWAKSQPPLPPGRRNAEVIPMERTTGIRDNLQLNGVLLNSQFSVLFLFSLHESFFKQSFLQLTRNCQSFPTVLLRKGSMEWKRNISKRIDLKLWVHVFKTKTVKFSIFIIVTK